ncbi:hypothetical protein BD309DRAFT_705969 [Dichomitus squalens]|nr:hypothetical protein BD309DRAFT_705969 [Dichomitus squalens]
MRSESLRTIHSSISPHSQRCTVSTQLSAATHQYRGIAHWRLIVVLSSPSRPITATHSSWALGPFKMAIATAKLLHECPSETHMHRASQPSECTCFELSSPEFVAVSPMLNPCTLGTKHRVCIEPGFLQVIVAPGFQAEGKTCPKKEAFFGT